MPCEVIESFCHQDDIFALNSPTIKTKVEFGKVTSETICSSVE